MENSRFRFRAHITLTYFDEEDNEKEISFICEPNGIFKDGEIGIYGDNLYDLLKQFEFSETEWYSLRNQLDNYEQDDNWYVLYPDYIEQCTGLKDKNGKLIYEGDIVDCKPFYTKRKVVWIDKDCRFNISSSIRVYDTGYEQKTEKMEVIGNIHENPELLEVQDE